MARKAEGGSVVWGTKTVSLVGSGEFIELVENSYEIVNSVKMASEGHLWGRRAACVGLFESEQADFRLRCTKGMIWRRGRRIRHVEMMVNL